MRQIIFFFLVSMVLPRLDALRAQSFEPATWIIEAEEVIFNYGLDADAGGSVYMSGAVHGKEIRWSDGTVFVPERNENFLARIAADGNVRWVRPGALSVGDYPPISIHTVVAQGPYVWTNEGATRGVLPFNTRWNPSAFGGILINRYSDAGDSLQATYLAGPVDNMFDAPAYILGLGGDDAGNMYVTGYYLDTLRLGPEHLLVPDVYESSSFRTVTRAVFLASYSHEGNVRWAHRMVSDGSGDVPPSHISYYSGPAKPSFDVDAAGNTYLGGFFSRGTVFAEGQPDSVRLEESGGVVASFDATGKLRWLRTASDLGVEADYLAFTDYNYLHAENTAVPWTLSARDDGELALAWTVEYGWRGIEVAVGDTTFTVPSHDEGRWLDFVTRHAPDGSVNWARRLTTSGIDFLELTEIAMDMHGHVYVGGMYYGHQVQIEDTVLTNGLTPGSVTDTGLLVEYDAEGTLARTLQVTGPRYSRVSGIQPMPNGELYVAGFAFTFFRDGPGHIIVGVDTLAMRPRGSKAFLAKYGPVTIARADEYARPVGSLWTAHYPNPFAGAATITYELPEASHVRLRVYDILGREMAMLVDEWHSAGAHSVRLDASSWPSGVYLYRLEAGNQVVTGSLVRQK